MELLLAAVGTRMPKWVTAGFDDYQQRLPRQCQLTLKEIRLARRQSGDSAEHVMGREGQQLLAATERATLRVALAVDGRSLSTEQLARELGRWQEAHRTVALMVGGPDGLAPAVLDAADMHWSLSPLTLPHALVRVLVAEQIYRAHTILTGHPYHRA